MLKYGTLIGLTAITVKLPNQAGLQCNLGVHMLYQLTNRDAVSDVFFLTAVYTVQK